jgi:uncharacterized membrane protein
MGWLFQALFKYPALVFEQGDFRFAMSRSGLLGLLAVAAVAVAALVTYRGLTQEGDRPRDRAILVAIRLGVIGVLLFCLFRPLLVLKAAVPQQNFLGVLLDDSRSMTIADSAGKPRTDFVTNELAQPTSPLLDSLSKRFVLRYFRFSTSAERIASPAGLQYTGTTSRLGAALERARDELAGLPLAGLIMVTDGADTSEAALDASLASLKARQIPVFPIGVGQERFDHDIQITRVEAPRSTLKGTSLSVDVVVSQTGYSGSVVKLNVEDEGRIVGSQDVVLPANGESTTVRVTFTASDPGPRKFRFQIPPQPGEQVVQNNTRDALVEVADRQERILYYEGEPRYETAFIRRAVQDDKNLQVVLLVRTAENKFWRGDVAKPDELVGGFPKTREELFSYKAVILGSVEAASFTGEQLNMLADFVSKRGGGLLMLGGRRAFSEGGWAGTPLADVLPVELGQPNTSGANGQPEVVHVAVRPTREGVGYPVVQIAPTEDKSKARWDEMPTVTSVNPVHEVKRGATKLLVGVDPSKHEQVVLAYQRYGRGKAVAFPIQDSWIWKMDATIKVEDMTHATFWRRMVRWLVDSVPDPVSITTSLDRVDPGEPLKLTAQVMDPAFAEVNDARVFAQVTSPSGRTTEVPLEWTVNHDGEYVGTFVPDEVGDYEVKAAASRDESELGTSLMHARVTAGDSEYFDAAMRAPLLKRIAEDTGGRFFTPATAASLPEAISYSGRGVTVVEERDLWDMPIVFVALLGLMGGEWLFRRKRGLA